MVAPKGYKETDIGCIPVEWECVIMDDLIDEISMGPFGSDITVSNFVSFGVPVLNGYNVSAEVLKDYFTNFVTPQKAKSLKKAIAHRGDIIVTHRGTIGQISVIPNDSMYSEYVISQSQFRVRLKKEKANPHYVVLFFHSRQGQQHLLEGKGHTGVPALAQPTTTFRKIHVPLPSAPEQQAIVTALSDMDELIDSLENLIEKKKEIKQGAMQELLTGAKRLQKFGGKWEFTTLGKLLQIAHGKSQANIESIYGKYPILATGGVIGKTDIFMYDKESVLIGRKGTINRPLYMNTPFWTIDTLFYTVLSDEVNAKFIYYLFCSINWDSHNEASGVPSLSAKTISDIAVKIPDIKEQQAIAKILSDMDTEIEVLTQKLDKGRQIKQGMMQELLTGRIRLLEIAAQKQKKAKAKKAPKAEAEQQGHNEHFHEAVILSTVVSLFASEQFPLGRFRRQKFAYLLHRHAQESTQGFLKKAAGPYNPTIRYKDEKIALKAGYVTELGKGKFVQGEKSNEAVAYFVQWYGENSIEWLKQFQYRKNDDLEVLTTVAEAIVDLKKSAIVITVQSIKQVIRENPEWRPKLSKDCFSDFKIQSAIKESQKLFA